MPATHSYTVRVREPDSVPGERRLLRVGSIILSCGESTFRQCLGDVAWFQAVLSGHTFRVYTSATRY